MTATSAGPDLEEAIRALVEAQDLCAKLKAAEAEAARASRRSAELEDSVAFRLGSLLLDTIRSPGGVLALPGALASLARHWRNRAKATHGQPASPGSVAPGPRLELPGAGLVRAWHRPRRPVAPASLSDFRVAAVVDPFTCAGFAPDCRLLNLRIADIAQQIDTFQPHVLFVESAWRGQGGDWMHKVSPCSGELERLVDMCRRRAIPTVFWCKEDPSHFDDFIAAAALFDHVFTTDSDCVARYRARLGHDRIGVLGFACQPALHNPVEHGKRKVAASFAGSWYARYPARAKDFESLLTSIQPVLPVEIYDRNHDRADPAFEYPARYRHLIRDGVPYDRISEVYKACEFAITINTITSSPTMFARRTHELLACNTITISNQSVGVDSTFGELVLMAERDNLGERLTHLRDSQDARHRLRLRGLREVMAHHTAALRLAEIATVSVGPVTHADPEVWVLARANSRAELDRLTGMFLAQEREQRRLLVAVPDAFGVSDALPAGIGIVAGAAADEAIAELIPDDGWIAPWHTGDYYGPCYLLDLMHATRYTDALAVGKATHFTLSDGEPRLATGAPPYSNDAQLWPRSSVMKAALLRECSLREVVDSLDEQIGVPLRGLGTDEFGYCRHGAGHAIAGFVDVD